MKNLLSKVDDSTFPIDVAMILASSTVIPDVTCCLSLNNITAKLSTHIRGRLSSLSSMVPS